MFMLTRWAARSPRRGTISVVAVVTFLLLIALALVLSRRVGDFAAPAADSGTPLPPPVAQSVDEQAFYVYLAPRLRSISAESDALAQLGESRSRNILVLQTRENRVAKAAEEIDVFLASRPTPPRFEASVSDYQNAISTLRTSIIDARQAILRFDWTALQSAVDTFSTSADEIAAASRAFEGVVVTLQASSLASTAVRSIA